MTIAYSCFRDAIAAAAVVLSAFDSLADAVDRTAEVRPALHFAQRQEPAKPASANIRQMQEQLVWIGYYDGPIDGDVGAGTTAAVKQFQRDLGATETGILSPQQSRALAERADGQVQASGFEIETDSATGIRVGIPLAITSQKKRVAGGTNFQSPDGRTRIGLRTFRTGEEFRLVFERLKDAFKPATLPYSVVRNDWMVLSGENENKRFYVRYHGRNDLVSGFFAIYDKELPKETTTSLSAAITIMSLTMQPYAPGFDGNAAPRLATAAITEPASLVQQPAATGVTQTSEPRTQAPEPRTQPAEARTQSPAPTTQAAHGVPRTDDAALRAAQRKVAELEAERTKASETLENERNDQRLLAASLAVTVAMLGLLVAYLVMRLRGQGSRSPQNEWADAHPASGGSAAPIERTQGATRAAESTKTPIGSSPQLATAFPPSQPRLTAVAADPLAATRGAAQSESVLSAGAPIATVSGAATKQGAVQQALLAIGGIILVGLLIVLVVGIASKIIGL
jgi:hypothetical protein